VLAIFSIAARSHLAACQIEKACATAEFRHFEQRAAAGLLNIVAVGCNCEYIQ
jgi:hypothetical protein